MSVTTTDETTPHLHKLGESCADCDESRRLLKATPVEIVATFADHEAKLTVPLWMFHSFVKMSREFDAQTPGVTYPPMDTYSLKANAT